MSATYAESVDDQIRTGRERMEALCESFPVLRGRPGTSPWDQHAFAAWASGPAPTGASRQAAAFVLSVWNWGTPADGGWWNQEPYSVGVFDPVEAMTRWDVHQQTAFIAWCENPFFP